MSAGVMGIITSVDFFTVRLIKKLRSGMFRELERLSDLPKALQSNFLRSNLVPQLEI